MYYNGPSLEAVSFLAESRVAANLASAVLKDGHWLPNGEVTDGEWKDNPNQWVHRSGVYEPGTAFDHIVTIRRAGDSLVDAGVLQEVDASDMPEHGSQGRSGYAIVGDWTAMGGVSEGKADLSTALAISKLRDRAYLTANIGRAVSLEDSQGDYIERGALGHDSEDLIHISLCPYEGSDVEHLQIQEVRFRPEHVIGSEYGVVSLFGESSRGTISEGTEFGDRINRLVELELVTEALLGVDCVVRGLTDRLRRAGKLE